METGDTSNVVHMFEKDDGMILLTVFRHIGFLKLIFNDCCIWEVRYAPVCQF